MTQEHRKDADLKDSAHYVNNLFALFEPALKEQIIQYGSLRSFGSGEILMETGQYFRSTILLLEGRVKVYREGPDGGEFFIYYLEPGNACALSLICATRQQTSQIMAKAVEPSLALTLPIQLMDELMRNYKSWYYFVLESYRTRMEELLSVIDSIAFKSMDERLEAYIEKQCKKLASNQLRITHQEIASDLSTSREVISRLLKKMEQDEKVVLQRNYIEYLSSFR